MLGILSDALGFRGIPSDPLGFVERPGDFHGFPRVTEIEISLVFPGIPWNAFRFPKIT